VLNHSISERWLHRCGHLAQQSGHETSILSRSFLEKIGLEGESWRKFFLPLTDLQSPQGLVLILTVIDCNDEPFVTVFTAITARSETS